MTPAEPHKPLAGIRVLEISRVLAGPFATKILADLGADVIKVENTREGDTTRTNHPIVNGVGHYFMAINRNKRSLSVDVRKPEGIEALRRLIADTDVVIHNYRPTIAAQLGLDYDSVRPLNPEVVYCAISGFGDKGPRRHDPAYSIVVEAIAGAVDITGMPDEPPVKMGIPIADLSTSLFAAIGVLAAVRRRRVTGEGGDVAVSLYDSTFALMSYLVSSYAVTGEAAHKLGSGHQTIYPYNAFQTKDGFIVVACFTGRFWRKFSDAIGRSDLAEAGDLRSFAQRLARRDELEGVLDPIMRERTTAEWERTLTEADVPNGPVLSVGEALDLPQTLHREMVVDHDHPEAGQVRIVGTPFNYEYADGERFQPEFEPCPALGQHTDEVLASVGYDAAGLERLKSAGAVLQAPGSGNAREAVA